VTSADNGQVEKNGTEEHKTRSELQGGTANTLISNLASCGIGGGLIMMHFHSARHAELCFAC